MECEWHPGETAVLTCLQCGKQYCQQCITETRDTYYCPDCHREHVSDLASKLSVGGPRPKTKKEKRKGMRAEKAAIPGLLERLEEPEPLTEPEPLREPAAPSVQIEPGPSEPSPERPEPPKEHMVAEVLQQPEPSPERLRTPPPAPPEPPKEHMVAEVLQQPVPSIATEPGTAQVEPREVTKPKESERIETDLPNAKSLKGKKAQESPGEKQKRLRRPVERSSEVTPPPSLSSEERAVFWGDVDKSRWKGRHVETRAPLPGPPEKEPERPQPASEPAWSSAAAPVAREEIPEIASQDEVAKVAPKVEPTEVVSKDAVVKAALEETAVKASPTGDEEELPREGATRAEKRERVISPDEVEVKDHFAPRLPKRGAHRREKPARKSATVALQTPEDYEGAVTWDPTYLKAVLFGLLAGLLLAGAYAGFEWWRHSGRWILGWVIGFVVGIVVVFASGRHFNWQLGLVSTLISWFSLCLGQMVFSMLDVRFNNVLPWKLPLLTLLNQSARELWSALGSLWLVMLLIAGLVAFLVSFRPWPIRFQISPHESAGESHEPSEPGKVARPGA